MHLRDGADGTLGGRDDCSGGKQLLTCLPPSLTFQLHVRSLKPWQFDVNPEAKTEVFVLQCRDLYMEWHEEYNLHRPSNQTTTT